MVVVHPPLNLALSPDAADELVAAGLFADNAAGLAQAFGRVCAFWAEAEVRAQGLDPALLDQRVDGEWSFIETIRHLIFATTDAWINGILLGNPPNFHPLGMPPAHAADAMRTGLVMDARPSLDDVLIVRSGRQAMARAEFDAATDETLTLPAGGSGAFGNAVGGVEVTVAAALQVIVSEEARHLQYANRDLDVLTGVAT